MKTLPTKRLMTRFVREVLAWFGHVKKDVLAARWELLALLGLISPMLLHGFLGSIEATWGNGLYWFNLLTSILWIGLMWGIPVSGRIKRWGLILLGVTVLAEWFMVIHFRTRLSSGYLFLLFSNASEWDEFTLTYSRTVIPLALLGALFWGACWFGMGGSPKPKLVARIPLLLLSLLALLGAYGGVFIRGILGNGLHHNALVLSAWDIANKEMGAPMGVFFQAAVVGKTQSETARYVSLRRGQSLQATQSVRTPGEIYVLVIGESSRPQNWGLLGYARNTTPRLAGLSNLVPFPHVLPPACVTAISVPGWLSFQRMDDWVGVISHKSVISAFRSAGFNTHWLSTQEMDVWAGGCIPVVAEEAKTRRYFDRCFDGVLVDEVRKLVGNRSSKPMLVVLHTKGSHFRFDRRYPGQFAKFPTQGVNYCTGLVNSYDNSILYTDWVLAEISKILEHSGRPAVLAYASDHGENLYDDSNAHFGHGIGTKYDLAAACFFWCSKSFVSAKPNKLGALASNAHKRVSGSSLAHTLAGLADLQSEFYRDDFDLASFSFEQKPRMYQLHDDLRIEAPPAD